MDIKGSETHLLPGWGGCPVKTPTEKIPNKSQIMAERARSVAEITVAPFGVLSQKRNADVPDVGGKSSSCTYIFTQSISGSQMRISQVAIHAVQAESRSSYVV